MFLRHLRENLCKPNAMKLASIAEVQPNLSKLPCHDVTKRTCFDG